MSSVNDNLAWFHFKIHKHVEKSILFPNTVKPVLETTCIKRPPALRDHCSDTTTLLKGGYLDFSHLTELKNYTG